MTLFQSAGVGTLKPSWIATVGLLSSAALCGAAGGCSPASREAGRQAWVDLKENTVLATRASGAALVSFSALLHVGLKSTVEAADGLLDDKSESPAGSNPSEGYAAGKTSAALRQQGRAGRASGSPQAEAQLTGGRGATRGTRPGEPAAESYTFPSAYAPGLFFNVARDRHSGQ